MKKVAVIILNYKLKEQTLECIKSVQKSNYKNLKLIVVDNNSDDGLASEINKNKDLLFIQSGDNLGYSGGNNIGIRKAISQGADFIFVLNPDTTIESNTIKILAEESETLGYDIASPKIYLGISKTFYFAGKTLDKLNVLGLHRGINELDVGQFDKAEEIDDAAGAALFIKREVFEKVGLFDERFFLYYEDSDFIFRAKSMGFKIMYIPKAVVYHLGSQATKLGSPLQDYFITRNRLLFAKKYLSRRTQFALIREVLRNFNNKSRRMALFDFITNNFGKGSFLKNQ